MVTWGSQGHGLEELPSRGLRRQGQESRLRLAREDGHRASPPSPPTSCQSPKGQGPGKPASSGQPCDAEPSRGRGGSESKGPGPGQDWGPGERISPASSSLVGAAEPPALPLRLPAPKTLTGSRVTSSFIHGGGTGVTRHRDCKARTASVGGGVWTTGGHGPKTPVTPTLSARRWGWSRHTPPHKWWLQASMKS